MVCVLEAQGQSVAFVSQLQEKRQESDKNFLAFLTDSVWLRLRCACGAAGSNFPSI